MASSNDKDYNRARDRELGMDRDITRRDFLNGMAIGAGGVLASAWLPGMLDAQTAATGQDALGYYPPTLTGMRGSHPGSFETAHAVRDGDFWEKAGKPVDTGENYDLIVVGGGISGLAAAYFYRKQTPSVRILILDNHDDFGGHAKRNEFRPGGRLLLTNGGTVAIESPFPYSKQARELIAELGIDPPAFQKEYTDRDAYQGMGFAYFFDKETFEAERLVTGAPSGYGRGRTAGGKWADFLAKTPLSAEAQKDIVRIQEDEIDYMTGVPQAEKKSRLSRMSYKDFLLNLIKAHPEALKFYQTRTHGLYGIGIDAVPALDCWAIHFPGFQGMGLDRVPSKGLSFTALGEVTPQEEYHFHFPDGNASIARLLVRSLVPGSAPGNTAEDIVTAKMDYNRLDHSDSAVRIRLNSTAVAVHHAGDKASAKTVEVIYGREGKVYSVRGKGTVLACWNVVIPYICPDLPPEQKQALHYGVKVPLVYTVVALRNWSSFHKLGIRGVSCPGMYHSSINLDQAINIGEYKPARSAEDPILVRMLRTPCQPGLPAREQQRAGHYELLATPFETFERNIRDQLARVLGSGGFDPARDIEAITVNRWPHGYAYEYNPLWDPDWPQGSGHAISLDNDSEGLPLPTPMRRRLPTPTRQSIKVIELCRNYCRADVTTLRRSNEQPQRSPSSLFWWRLALGLPCFAQQLQAEREILDLAQKMNAVYAANHLPAYFAYYSPDFTQWLPEGHTDLPQYEKMWTGFIKSGGRMESDHIPDMKVQMGPS